MKWYMLMQWIIVFQCYVWLLHYGIIWNRVVYVGPKEHTPDVHASKAQNTRESRKRSRSGDNESAVWPTSQLEQGTLLDKEDELADSDQMIHKITCKPKKLKVSREND